MQIIVYNALARGMNLQLIIVAVIVCAVVMILMKVLKKETVQKSTCSSCGKSYGGNPAKCPHCGEKLRWTKD